MKYLCKGVTKCDDLITKMAAIIRERLLEKKPEKKSATEERDTSRSTRLFETML